MSTDKLNMIMTAGCTLVLVLALIVGCMSIKGAISDTNSDTEELDTDMVGYLEHGRCIIKMVDGSTLDAYTVKSAEQSDGTLTICFADSHQPDKYRTYYVPISQIAYIYR